MDTSTGLSAGLNAGLTQALSDGTSTYIYGNGRIAQVNSITEYFLGDALGSVRQLTNPSGSITYAKVYDPYGVVTAAAGTSQSAYGFTSEYTSNDLVYLRARHYAPSMGRFLTRDTWNGNSNMPMSFNLWNYGYGNPVNLTDPTGHFPAECLEADDVAQCLRDWATEGRDCNDNLCPEPPKVTNPYPIHKSYKALLETPCERKNGKLYPWWKSKGALQQTYAPMDVTMLVAVLVYTEASPLKLNEKLPNAEEARNVWTKMAANRFGYQCSQNVCNISQDGTELGYGLAQFLGWSPRFRSGPSSYANSATSRAAIYDKIYKEPKWAYDIAKEVVKGTWNPNDPYGGMNTQTADEQNHFLAAYNEYGKFSTEKEGVYYMWGKLKWDKWSDMVVLTWEQQKYHCGSGKYRCGN